MIASRSLYVIALSLGCALGLTAWSHTFTRSASSPAILADTGAVTLDTSAITPAMVSAGRQVFHGKGMCFACHGAKLEGGPVAPPLTAHHWKDAKGGELAAIYYVVTHGVSGTIMVTHPGGISDAEARNVAAYIWSVGHHGVKP